MELTLEKDQTLTAAKIDVITLVSQINVGVRLLIFPKKSSPYSLIPYPMLIRFSTFQHENWNIYKILFLFKTKLINNTSIQWW